MMPKPELVEILELNSVRRNLMDKKGWSERKTLEIEIEYRQFLTLFAKNPTEHFSPWSDDLDEFWHQHILDTRKYTKDCFDILGFYLHHDPNMRYGDDTHKALADNTEKVFERTFGASREVLALF